ncbi:Rpn family recombination-promoting nuclease/putative transposase [Treponema zioleckii]|uniref:Rpn family recombination-promoting nuclease/putative transposase n=1 Tax=Treponema zioleckii TaxID=331680 RepID=UPI00168AB768|nr:Rpn family recombination-promoting nuclease/putative transposase [Treponema zioleckii]
MESEPEICKHVIEILLGIEIDRIEIPQTERTMQESFESKSVRFDVYAKDSDRIFDVEMQTATSKKLAKRSRYYQSIIDVEHLTAGTDYDELKDVYIIFICLGDVFGEKLPVYTFENVCTENGRTKLNDRTFKVFFNADLCDKIDSKERRNFLAFLKANEARDDFTETLRSKLALAKKNMKWRRQYMTWEQTLKEYAKDAFDEGVRETARNNAISLLKKTSLLPEMIADCCGLSVEEVLELKENLQTEAVRT